MHVKPMASKGLPSVRGFRVGGRQLDDAATPQTLLAQAQLQAADST